MAVSCQPTINFIQGWALWDSAGCEHQWRMWGSEIEGESQAQKDWITWAAAANLAEERIVRSSDTIRLAMSCRGQGAHVQTMYPYSRVEGIS